MKVTLIKLWNKNNKNEQTSFVLYYIYIDFCFICIFLYKREKRILKSTTNLLKTLESLIPKIENFQIKNRMRQSNLKTEHHTVL